MQTTKISTNFLDENCWILRNSENELVVIDPGSDTKKILETIGDAKVLWILLTHSHSDHLGALAEITKKTGGEAAIHSLESEIVKHGEANPPDFGLKLESIASVKKLKDGDILDFGKERIEVIHTPGHTSGSCCFQIGDELFSGDTLFRENVGRTDLPSGNTVELRKSLARLLKLPSETIIHPGHGEDWTIDQAKKFHFSI